MSGRFAFLSRFGVKFVEVAGAGFASAACAYFLGLIGQQPPVPPPAIVQVVPSEDAMRMARDDHALLAALVRKETEARKDAEGRKDIESRKDTEGQAKPEAAAAPKPPKAAADGASAPQPEAGAGRCERAAAARERAVGDPTAPCRGQCHAEARGPEPDGAARP